MISIYIFDRNDRIANETIFIIPLILMNAATDLIFNFRQIYAADREGSRYVEIFAWFIIEKTTDERKNSRHTLARADAARN